MHQFFPVAHLSLDERRLMCERARGLCDRWWVDVLDCSQSMCRQPVTMSFEEIMAKFDQRCHFAVIRRRSHLEDYLEVGFSTVGIGPDYFLWVMLNRRYAENLEEIGYRHPPTPTAPA